MKPISAIIRMIVGAAILFLSWLFYQKLQTAAAANESVVLVGQTYDPNSQAVTIGLAVIAIIGVAFLILGLMGLTRASK